MFAIHVISGDLYLLNYKPSQFSPNMVKMERWKNLIWTNYDDLKGPLLSYTIEQQIKSWSSKRYNLSFALRETFLLVLFGF